MGDAKKKPFKKTKQNKTNLPLKPLGSKNPSGPLIFFNLKKKEE
jgi:hypothetical protein